MLDKSTNQNVDLAGLRRYRLARVREQLQQRDLAAAVLFDPCNIRYATDSSNMQVWTLHNAARYAFVPAEGPVVLFDFHNCEFLSADIETVDEVRAACSWYYFSAGARVEEKARKWAAEIAELAAAHGGGNLRLALDHVDPAGAAALERLGLSLHNGQEVMEQARCIKSGDEIAAIRASIAACEEGMRRMHNALEPGISENELWAILHHTNIALGGEWIETRLLASGPRTNPWFHECGPRVIEDGDLVAFDTDMIGPHGYCADISRTWRCGGGSPSDEQRRLYATAREHVEFTRAQVRPGMTFREIAEGNYKLPDDCLANRYSVIMHGVGLADEYPHSAYLVDFESGGYDGTVEVGMTLCLESYVGAVGGAEGVKLEDQVLITDRGAEPLSTYPFEDDWI